MRQLAEIEPAERALALGAEHEKDPRLVQAVLDESTEVLRARDGVLICVTRHGFVCANAGIDRSNAGSEDELILLPADPDASARGLRASIEAARGVRPAVVVSDSFSRAWRIGQTDVALEDSRPGTARRVARAPGCLRPRATRDLDRGGGLRRGGRGPRAREGLAPAGGAGARARALRQRGRRPRRGGPPAPAGGGPVPLRASLSRLSRALGFEPQKICVPTIPTRWTITVFSTIDFAVAVPAPTGPPPAL